MAGAVGRALDLERVVVMGTRTRRPFPLVSVVVVVAMLGAACSNGGGAKPNQTPLSAKQTIVFATQGLGTEGAATKSAVAAFEKANPNIKVQLLVLSPTANNAYQQLTQRFIAGSSTPDVITADVIWPATFARAGWIAPLDTFQPDNGAFFPGQVAAGQYNGHTYAIPWFINAEGVYYRTDLVPTPPSSPQALVQAAKAAMAKDSSLKEGLAFEGAKYEGAVTAFVNFLGGFGGKLDPNALNTPQNVQALTFMRDTIYKYGITPQAATGWQESNVQDAYLSGQTPFAMNWPYIFALAEASNSPVKGKTGWIPFPSQVGTPAAALGGDELAINVKSQHQAAAWKFIQYLTSASVQIDRAVSAGDPPSLQSAYNSTLFSKAPFYRDEVAVFKVATPRPVNPNYPKISDALQTMLSSVLSNQETAQQGLSSAATTVKQAATGSGT
jgi:multiple sugar transport system substrate-binding protein